MNFNKSKVSLLLCLSILSLTRTNISNAIEFNDKFYGKINANILLGVNTYSGDISNIINNTNKDDRNKVSLNTNIGLGFDVFWKANDLLHPFVGLDVNGGYTVLGQITKDVSFNQFLNANFRFGTSFKVHKKVRINPYGFVGLNVSRFKRDEYRNITTKEILKSSIHNSVLEEFFKSKQGFENTGGINMPEIRDGTSYFAKYGQKITAYTNITFALNEDPSGLVNIDGKNYKEYDKTSIVFKPVGSKEDFLALNNIEHYNPLFLFEKEGKFIYYDLYSINGLYSDQYYEYLYDIFKNIKPGLTLEEIKNTFTKEPFDLTKGELFGEKLSQEEKLELLKNLEDHYDQDAEKKYSYIIDQNKIDKIEKEPQTNIGLNAGVGVDFVFIDRIIVGLEYKYSEVKFTNFNIKAQTHTVFLKAGYQFNF